MLCVQPWIHERLPLILNVVLAFVLIGIGALMFLGSGRRGTAAPSE
jgi:hypothetical protein